MGSIGPCLNPSNDNMGISVPIFAIRIMQCLSILFLTERAGGSAHLCPTSRDPLRELASWLEEVFEKLQVFKNMLINSGIFRPKFPFVDKIHRNCLLIV